MYFLSFLLIVCIGIVPISAGPKHKQKKRGDGEIIEVDVELGEVFGQEAEPSRVFSNPSSAGDEVVSSDVDDDVCGDLARQAVVNLFSGYRGKAISRRKSTEERGIAKHIDDFTQYLKRLKEKDPDSLVAASQHDQLLRDILLAHIVTQRELLEVQKERLQEEKQAGIDDANRARTARNLTIIGLVSSSIIGLAGWIVATIELTQGD